MLPKKVTLGCICISWKAGERYHFRKSTDGKWVKKVLWEEKGRWAK